MNTRETFTYFSNARCDGAAAVTALLATSNTGQAVDRQGYDSLTFNCYLLATSTAVAPATSYWYLRVEHTDASALGLGPSDYAVCGSIDVIRAASGVMTSGIIPIVASTYSGACLRVGYVGNKRYVRVNISTTGAMANNTSGYMFIEAQLGHAENWPVTTPNLDA